MKIVVISDIHANLEALTALPEWGDELWVLGDLVDYGPNPREVVALLRSRAELVVRGNHDHAVGFEDDPRCNPRFRKMALETRDFTIRWPARWRAANPTRISMCFARWRYEENCRAPSRLWRSVEAAPASSTVEGARRCRLPRWVLNLVAESKSGENQVA